MSTEIAIFLHLANTKERVLLVITASRTKNEGEYISSIKSIWGSLGACLVCLLDFLALVRPAEKNKKIMSYFNFDLTHKMKQVVAVKKNVCLG